MKIFLRTIIVHCYKTISISTLSHIVLLHIRMKVSLKTRSASVHRIIITNHLIPPFGGTHTHTHTISRDAHPMSSNSFAESKPFLALTRTSASPGRFEKQRNLHSGDGAGRVECWTKQRAKGKQFSCIYSFGRKGWTGGKCYRKLRSGAFCTGKWEDQGSKKQCSCDGLRERELPCFAQ